MLLLFFAVRQTDSASATFYLVCAGGCSVTIVIPVPACLAGCICFDIETTVRTRKGLRHLSTIQRGEEVMTLDDAGKEIYTKVVANPFMPGNFSFNNYVFADYHRHVTLTEEHPLCVGGSGKCKPKEGKDVVVGDRISAPTKSGFAEVAGISTRRGLGKYLLQTETCTVVANGIRVATLCNEEGKWADHTPTKTREEMLQWLESMDRDYDGKITGSEVLTEFDKYIMFLDRDGNGRVTSKDILEHPSFNIGDMDGDGDVDSDDANAAYISYMDKDADGDVDKDDAAAFGKEVMVDLKEWKKASAKAGKDEL